MSKLSKEDVKEFMRRVRRVIVLFLEHEKLDFDSEDICWPDGVADFDIEVSFQSYHCGDTDVEGHLVITPAMLVDPEPNLELMFQERERKRKEAFEKKKAEIARRKKEFRKVVRENEKRELVRLKKKYE